jgi:hypothetical protein
MATKSPPFIRYMVPITDEAEAQMRENDSLPPWYRPTPHYFNERQRAKAEDCARRTGSRVIDMFKEYDRRK